MSRFLLLTASMGAGHDAACDELAARLRTAGHDSEQVDVLSLLPGPLGDGVRDFYHLIIRRAPLIYSGIYAAFFRSGAGPRPAGTPLAALAEDRLLEAVARSRSDAVVSLFHLAAQLSGRARARDRLTVPCAALVTDFALHRQWLHPGNDLNLCLTEQDAEQVRRTLGRPAAVYGPLVSGLFRPHPAGEGLWRERFAGPRAPVVMSAGAWGAGSGFEYTAEVLRGAGYQPIVLCGRDERLRRRLAAGSGVIALDWVRDMPGLLAATAALLDNAAGQTALQALAVGVPVIGWRPIPGHGVEGVRRMAQLGLSDFATGPDGLLRALGRLVPDGPERAQRVADGRRLLEADVVRPLESMLDG